MFLREPIYFLHFKKNQNVPEFQIPHAKMSPEIREKNKKQTLKILMLKFAMPKGFCLKKKKVLINFAPQAVSSVQNCVLRYLSAYLKAALPPDPLELE